MGRLISDESKGLFPISTINNLITFIENEFINPRVVDEARSKRKPNLALLSIVLGRIEHSIVVPSTNGSTSIRKPRSNKVIKKQVQSAPDSSVGEPSTEAVARENGNGDVASDFPPLEYDIVLGLYDKFEATVYSGVNPEVIARDKNSPEGTSNELIKNISDIFWNSLTRNYLSDKPHLQTLYTYVTGYKLDSFGLALAVVAGCQVLGLDDVHLVLSEDHAWVEFGKGAQPKSTAEVTWHGKGAEDKRGRVIEDNLSWLYLKGSPVVCTRSMEMVAVVAAINPSINGISDSMEMGLIQQKLLWKFHGLGCLQKYPMALGHLAELEEISSPTVECTKVCTDLFEAAISSSKCYYKNMHVYPYIYYGGYLYRHDDFKGALKCWSDAAQVISNYRYSKVDEEIYKEFFEISKELLTTMMKKCSTGFSAKSPTRDPACYADLLRFFDGICLWEELGKTPVIHITWVQCWMNSLAKFESIAREGLKLFDEVEVPKPPDAEPMNCDTPTPTERSTSAFMDMNGNSKGTGLDEDGNPIISVYFRSVKMKGIKALLQKPKLNPGALALQLTAQQSSTPVEPTTTGKLGGRNRGSKTKCAEDPVQDDEVPASKKRKRVGRDPFE